MGRAACAGQLTTRDAQIRDQASVSASEYYISEPIVLLLCTKLPIIFDAPDHKPVSVLFVILVPEHANKEHLQILATVSEMFSDKIFRERLGTATEPGAIQRLFSERAKESH